MNFILDSLVSKLVEQIIYEPNDLIMPINFSTLFIIKSALKISKHLFHLSQQELVIAQRIEKYRIILP